MFTGIIVTQGELIAREVRAGPAAGGGAADAGERGDLVLVVDAPGLGAGRLAVGDSVSVEGVCLTATRIEGSRFSVDVSGETLSRTTLGALEQGARVNLEPALRAGDALGGHLVSGHVDAVGRVAARVPDARSWRFAFELPRALMRYVAPKGSICVNGVSLTVNEVKDDRFEVNIIPHTFEVTTFGRLDVGSRVNVEVDLVARYLERLLAR